MKPQKKPVISIVVGSYQRNNFLQATINSVRTELKNIDHEIIVIDGGSTDGSLKWLLNQKDIVSIVQHNRGEIFGRKVAQRSWGYFMNLGFKCAQGKYICMLSDDCLVLPNSILNGINLFEKSLGKLMKVGAIAFYWRNWPHQKEYVVGKTWGDNFFVNHGIYLKEALQEIDYIDEDAYHFYHADGDICMRLLEHGYTCIDSPTSFIEHYYDATEEIRSSNLSKQPQDWQTYTNRWRHKFGVPTEDWKASTFVDPNNFAEKFFPEKQRGFLAQLFRLIK
jgi:GT2 family glycosyltransferase